MKTILSIILSSLAILSAGCLQKGIPAKQSEKSESYVYISVSKEKNIKIFRFDPVNEKLEFKGRVDLPGEPGSLCFDPQKENLFAAVRSVNSVASMRINKESGNLSVTKITPVVHNPVYISTDKKGKYLFSSSYGMNTTAVYPITDDQIEETAIQVMDARINPHMIKTDPSGRFVFVPNLGGDVLQQFILREDGTLKPNDPDGMPIKSKSGPRHFIFHPLKDVMYVVNELGCTIMIFRFDPLKGTLSGPVQEISTLPEDFKAKNSCADIHVTPDGKFLYTSNRGHNSLAAFSINPDDNRLKLIDYYPTEKTPREFDIHPSGRYLVSAGEASGNIALYRIEKEGALTLLQTYEVGQWPCWVSFTEFNASNQN